jgi:calcineurin-like phosphoesterase family protein
MATATALARAIVSTTANSASTQGSGNHDHQTDAWYKTAGFADVHDWLIVDDKLFIHKPATSMNADVISLVEQVQPRVIVHGHIHDDRPNIPGHFNVAWDRHKRLIRMSEIDTLCVTRV